MGAKTKGVFMTIEVTGCHDCPFADGFVNKCVITKMDNGFSIFTQTLNSFCPLKQETITIKLKENDTTD